MKEYEYRMIQEIEESPSVIEDLLSRYTRGNDFKLDEEMINCLKGADQVIFLACGTSFHASHIGVYLFRKMGKMSDIYIASEWAYNPVIYGKKPVFILVSQSGETADIIACRNHLHGPIIAITNARGSTIDRMADYVLPLDCGEEKAIAATKSYVAQVAMIALLCKAVANDNSVIKELANLKNAISKVIDEQSICEKLASLFIPAKDAFFLGRGIDHFAALEASLKLKETCYIHSEAYPGGELKHGPVALVQEGVVVVGFISDDQTAELFRTNLDYTKEQNGTLVVISSKHLAKEGDAFVTDDVAYYLEPVVKVVVMQLVAYYTSKGKGINVDNPRSLVKAVTVE